MDTLNIFMYKRKMPRPLQKRVRNYYEYLLAIHGMDDQTMLSNLPEHLRFDVSLFLNRDLISKVPFFRNCEEGFIKRLAVDLSPRLFSPGETIIKAGDIGDEMYFISKGKVEIRSAEGNLLGTFGSGSFFGEIALVFQCLVRFNCHFLADFE